MRETFWDRLRNIVPSRYDDPDVRLFKILIYALVGAVFLMILAGLTTFLFSLRGAEETMVPDVQNVELLDAMLALQERALAGTVEVRYSADPGLAGMVIGQSPPPGTLVRAGKEIELIVSRGARIDRIGTYVGRSITEVRAELRAMFATGEQTIELAEPQYVFSEEEPGTVIAQDPAPGTEITEITTVDLVVSRGSDVERIELPSFVDLPFETALQRLSQSNIPFRFNVRAAEPDERSGLVVEQDPQPQAEVAIGSFVNLTITRPAFVPEDEVFGMLERSLPDYPVEVELTLEAQSPTGDREVVFSMLHPGEILSVPYQVPENSSLILYRSGQEIFRTIARRSVDEPVEDGEADG
ncbi:MAG: PASTA domain-containing protein [Spirochaetales bacterium]